MFGRFKPAREDVSIPKEVGEVLDAASVAIRAGAERENDRAVLLLAGGAGGIYVSQVPDWLSAQFPRLDEKQRARVVDRVATMVRLAAMDHQRAARAQVAPERMGWAAWRPLRSFADL